MKLVISQDREKKSLVVGDFLYLIPSHYGIKKDIYAYNCVGEYVGVVSNKDRDGFNTRDDVNNELAKVIHTTHASRSIKCIVNKVGDKTIQCEVVSSQKIVPNISVNKSSVEVKYCELAHTPSRNAGTSKDNNVVISYDVDAIPVRELTMTATQDNTINIKNSGVDNMRNTNTFGGMNLNNIFGGEIGMVKDDKFKIGMNGTIAVRRNTGDYITFDTDGNPTNVSSFAFDMGGLFVLPVTVDKVKKGDIVIKDNEPLYVDKDGKVGENLVATSIDKSEVKEFKPTKSFLLGNEFVRKVVSPFSMFNGAGTDGMMGNPFMMLALTGNIGNQQDDLMTTLMLAQAINGDGAMDMQKMLPFMLLSKGGNGSNDMMSTMVMMSTLSGNGMSGLFGTPSTTRKEENKAVTKEDIKEIVNEALNS